MVARGGLCGCFTAGARTACADHSRAARLTAPGGGALSLPGLRVEGGVRAVPRPFLSARGCDPRDHSHGGRLCCWLTPGDRLPPLHATDHGAAPAAPLFAWGRRGWQRQLAPARGSLWAYGLGGTLSTADGAGPAGSHRVGGRKAGGAGSGNDGTAPARLVRGDTGCRGRGDR